MIVVCLFPFASGLNSPVCRKPFLPGSLCLTLRRRRKEAHSVSPALQRRIPFLLMYMAFVLLVTSFGCFSWFCVTMKSRKGLCGCCSHVQLGSLSVNLVRQIH